MTDDRRQTTAVSEEPSAHIQVCHSATLRCPDAVGARLATLGSGFTPQPSSPIVLISPYGIENRGIRYISAVLRQEGFTPHLVLFKRWINNQIQPPTPTEVRLLTEHIAAQDPLLVAMGFGAPYFQIATQLTAEIRKATPAPVLWGGVHPTVCPEDCIPHTDFVCVGEGEYPTLDLCRALAEGRDPGTIPNLWSNVKGTITRNECRPLLQDLDALPFPDTDQPGTVFIEDNRVRNTDPITQTAEYRIYPTRGCPYACTYCHNSVLRGIFDGKGKYYRTRSPENLIAELADARKRLPRIRRVKFDGDVFAFPGPWLETFCRSYREAIGIPFEILTYPGELNEQALRDLKAAGLIKLQTGIQSGSDDEVREVYGRRSTAAMIRELTQVAHRVGIEVVYDIIFDNPLATRSDKRAMIELLLDLERPFLIYLYSLTVFPKTGLAKDLLDRGLITADDIEGRATKSFHQFRLSFDYPRSKEDIFWIALTMLSSKRFIPRSFIRRAMDSETLMAHPWPLRTVAQLADLAKAAGLALAMLLHGELTLFKIRQYGSFKRVITQ